MNDKQLQLAPCLHCAGPMLSDYCCKGCMRLIHWFCSEGDPAMNETLRHGAHYICKSCNASQGKKKKQGAALQECWARQLAIANNRKVVIARQQKKHRMMPIVPVSLQEALHVEQQDLLPMPKFHHAFCHKIQLWLPIPIKRVIFRHALLRQKQ
jgi:hypothetical protein